VRRGIDMSPHKLGVAWMIAEPLLSRELIYATMTSARNKAKRLVKWCTPDRLFSFTSIFNADHCTPPSLLFSSIILVILKRKLRAAFELDALFV
jgi:hypothetical protein